MEESEGNTVIVIDDDDENSGSDNEEDSNDEQENNENNDSEEDSSDEEEEEADVSSNDDEGDTLCNSERCGGDSDYEATSMRDSTLVTVKVDSHEYREVEVDVESPPKRKEGPEDEGRPSSSNPTPQSSSTPRKNYNFKKNKGKGKAGNAEGKNLHTQRQSCNPPPSKGNVNNQKGANFKNSNSEGYRNAQQSPSQQNNPHPKNSNNNSSNKGGDNQNWSKNNKSQNNPNQNANKGNNSNNNNSNNNKSSGGKNNNNSSSSNNNNNISVNKGQNNNKNNNNNNNKNNNNNNDNNNNKKKKSNEKKGPEDYSIFSKNIMKEAKDLVKSIMMKKVSSHPLDSPILRLHYRLSVLLFVLLYTIIQGCWIWKEAIICVNGFNADAEVPYRIKNFCLSYPFIYEDFLETDERERQRRYILFYRWTHHSFLIVASLFYLPRILAKTKDNPRLKQLLHDLALGEHRYDGSTCEQDTNKMLKYINNHGSTHGYLYCWLIICHVVALVIDYVVVWYLDYILQGRFVNLVYSAYPFHRDPQFFTDELSQTFPPFVRCTVEKQVYINNERDEWFGCHLLLMDIYDKMFVVIWFWLAFLLVVTVITILALILWVIPPFNRLFLLMHTNSKHVKKLRDKIVKKYHCTDLYVLHLMKRYRSEAEFLMVMSGLVHSEDPSDTLMESKLKKNKVSFKDEVTSNGNCLLQQSPSVGQATWCMDSTCQLSSGFAFEEAIRNRKVDGSTPNPKWGVDTSFHKDLKIV